jgi:hypothetical protein
MEITAEKTRSRAYKWKYEVALGGCGVLGVLLTGMALLSGWLLYGNTKLLKELEAQKIQVIMPNGRTVTSR